MEKERVLLGVIRQNYASVVWTHKVQEKQAEIYNKRYGILETINVFVAALTSCGIITTIFLDNLLAQIVTTILSFITLGITAYFKSFNLKELENQSKSFANQFIVIRNELLQLIADIKINGKDFSQINKTYEEVMGKLNKLYVDAPSTTQKALEMAEKALKTKKEYSFTDEEIDIFLPKQLREGK